MHVLQLIGENQIITGFLMIKLAAEFSRAENILAKSVDRYELPRFAIVDCDEIQNSKIIEKVGVLRALIRRSDENELCRVDEKARVESFAEVVDEKFLVTNERLITSLQTGSDSPNQ